MGRDEIEKNREEYSERSRRYQEIFFLRDATEEPSVFFRLEVSPSRRMIRAIWPRDRSSSSAASSKKVFNSGSRRRVMKSEYFLPGGLPAIVKQGNTLFP